MVLNAINIQSNTYQHRQYMIGWSGAGVGVGMLRGVGFSWFLGFRGLLFQSLLVSKFLGFDLFLGSSFLVSKSLFRGFNDLPNFGFMFSGI